MRHTCQRLLLFACCGLFALLTSFCESALADAYIDLTNAITEAASLLPGVVEGGLYGEYPVGATDALQAGIDEAHAVADDPQSLPADHETALSELTTRVSLFHRSRIGMPIYHILSTGQSLSEGSTGDPALSTNQPYANMMLLNPYYDNIFGPPTDTNLLPLIETTNMHREAVETISSAMANTITWACSNAAVQTIVSRHGISGYAYTLLKKGGSGPAYANGMKQLRYATDQVAAMGREQRVLCMTSIHGESDHIIGSGLQYESYLNQWQADYESDIQALTGQAESVPFFICQMSAFNHLVGADVNPLVTMAQLYASENNPKIHLVCPKYFFYYNDGLHLKNTSYRWLGEYYAKVIRRVQLMGLPWKPLSPRRISVEGKSILMQLYVPEPPIVLDTSNVLFKANYGLEYVDDGSGAIITNVTVAEPTVLKVELDRAPGANPRLRYAYTAPQPGSAGAMSPTAARGNVRDSDATPSLHGNNLYNWLVHFDKPVPYDDQAAFFDVTLETVPAGLQLGADSAFYVAPRTFVWYSNSIHNIAAPSPQTNGLVRYRFESWSDGGEQAHPYTAGTTEVVTAIFSTQFLWSVAVSPPGAGRVDPPSAWTNIGASFTAYAIPDQANGWYFDGWGGDLTGPETNQDVTMNSGVIATARFANVNARSVAIETDPAGRTLIVDDAPTTAPSEFVWPAGSVHTVEVAEAIQEIGRTRYIFRNWEDGSTAAARTFTVSENTNLTAHFETQYFWTWDIWPNAGYGHVVPGTSNWYPAGAAFTAYAFPDTEFAFHSWSGNGFGGETNLNIVMDGPIHVTANFGEPPDGNIVYVNHTALGNNTGTNWHDAYVRLSDALANHASNDIWVAEGIYKPGTLASHAFELGDNRVYGGFAGNEIARDQRDPAWHPSILSGELDRVIFAKSVVRKTTAGAAVLDGVTVRDGKGTVSGDHGVGLQMTAGSIAISNVVFRNCVTTAGYGGGIYAANSAAGISVWNSRFDGDAALFAGDVYIGTLSSDVTIDGCTFTGSRAGHAGSIRLASTAVNCLRNLTFTDIAAESPLTYAGGVVYSESGASNIFENCRFENCSMAGSIGGGAVAVNAGVTEIRGCVFTNVACAYINAHGGAIRIGGTNAQAVTIEGCTFSRIRSGTSGGHGGAIWVDDRDDTVLVSDCTFTDTVSGVNGGAIYMESTTTNILRRLTFAGGIRTSSGVGSGGAVYLAAGVENRVENSAFSGVRLSGNGAGGALFVNAGRVVVSGCEFFDTACTNALGEGGAVAVAGTAADAVTFSNCAFRCTTAGANSPGGAIHVAGRAAPVTVVDCEFREAAAGQSGGAIFTALATPDSPRVLDRCMFVACSNAVATYDGGAVYISDAAAGSRVVNSVFARNRAADDGGGLYFGGGALSVLHCTFHENRAGDRGGGIYQANGQASSTNSTYSLNAGVAGHEDISAAAGWTGLDYCNLDISRASGIDAMGGHMRNAAPAFVNPEASNFHLRKASPLIDAGVALPDVDVDLAGAARPRDEASDIGAYEDWAWRTGIMLKVE